MPISSQDRLGIVLDDLEAFLAEDLGERDVARDVGDRTAPALRAGLSAAPRGRGAPRAAPVCSIVAHSFAPGDLRIAAADARLDLVSRFQTRPGPAGSTPAVCAAGTCRPRVTVASDPHAWMRHPWRAPDSWASRRGEPGSPRRDSPRSSHSGGVRDKSGDLAMRTHARVVVIGGGVVGVSTLYHLAKKGWSDVVLDRAQGADLRLDLARRRACCRSST